MGHLESVRILLRVIVRIDSRNELGKTPMHLAAENGHFELANISPLFSTHYYHSLFIYHSELSGS